MRRHRQAHLITRRHWRQWTAPYLAPLDAARQRFVAEAVQGVLVAGCLVLTAMARALRRVGSCVEYVLKRFSRHLASKAWTPATLHDRLLTEQARWVREDTPVYIDLTDIAKPYARKMPHLCRVRDASSEEKRITAGYWLLEAYAEPSPGFVLPLLLAPFSTRQPRFLSQNHFVISCLERLHAALEGRG